uniref:Putative GTPase activating protein n=1 Tax=Trypanosoma congolense (strain IL3000) TaxID=1068625 RepID=G0UX62_TRYCI|nr:putative GTPase activating protein [Trypanosoma congolense IL3000]
MEEGSVFGYNKENNISTEVGTCSPDHSVATEDVVAPDTSTAEPGACSEGRASDHGATLSSAVQSPETENKEFIDEFGFLIDEEELNMELKHVKGAHSELTARREKRWRMVANWEATNTRNREKLKSLCRKGIPRLFRSGTWQLLLGSYVHILDPVDKGVYEVLREKDIANKELKEIISRDVSRTFTKHIMYREAGGAGQTLLRNVLHAYACADPEVGYVQGMGFVVCTLSTQMNEVETFWALHTLMKNEKHRMREMYRPGFPMLHQQFYQLRRLMAKLLPRLYKHFETLGVSPPLYASQWFLTLFVCDLEFRAVLRVWDVFMSEGWKIIFRIAIALLKWEERRLLSMPFDEVIPAMKTLHQGKDSDELLQRAHNVRFKTAELEAFAREFASSQVSGG